MLRIVNFAGFYVGWFACVAGAARGMPILGPLVVGLLLMLHVFMAHHRARETRLILLVGAIGFVVDTALAIIGVYRFPIGSLAPWMSPPWLVAIWMLFASTLNVSMSWLTGRYAVAAVLGGIAGPVSYSYGARLGAIAFLPNATISLAALAVVWAIATPFLLWLAAPPTIATPPDGRAVPAA